jgi:hypothetical protein
LGTEVENQNPVRMDVRKPGNWEPLW